MKELRYAENMPLDNLREQVTEDLVQRYSKEAISLDEFERRTALVTRAATKAEIIQAVIDLPEFAGRQAPMPSAGKGGWRIATETPREVERSLCVFGGSDRRGVWRVPRKFDSICVFGGSNLDLRKAILPPGGVTIKVLAVFGGVDIIVPPDLRLEVHGGAIFGGFDHRETPDADESAPLVRVEGFACFGGVSVRVRA